MCECNGYVVAGRGWGAFVLPGGTGKKRASCSSKDMSSENLSRVCVCSSGVAVWWVGAYCGVQRVLCGEYVVSMWCVSVVPMCVCAGVCRCMCAMCVCVSAGCCLCVGV